MRQGIFKRVLWVQLLPVRRTCSQPLKIPRHRGGCSETVLGDLLVSLDKAAVDPGLQEPAPVCMK